MATFQEAPAVQERDVEDWSERPPPVAAATTPSCPGGSSGQGFWTGGRPTTPLRSP